MEGEAIEEFNILSVCLLCSWKIGVVHGLIKDSMISFKEIKNDAPIE